jgi:hypothetical protein
MASDWGTAKSSGNRGALEQIMRYAEKKILLYPYCIPASVTLQDVRVGRPIEWEECTPPMYDCLTIGGFSFVSFFFFCLCNVYFFLCPQDILTHIFVLAKESARGVQRGRRLW